MKRTQQTSIPFYTKAILFLVVCLAYGSSATFVTASPLHGATGSSSCTNEIELTYSGFAAQQSLAIDIAYSTGQSEMVSAEADSSGQLSITFPRYTSDEFTFSAEIIDGNEVIGISLTCPAIQSEGQSVVDNSNQFVCTPAFYQVLGSTLYQLDTDTFQYKTLGSHTRNYNAIGYNVQDDFLYGIEKISNKLYLVQIDSNGVLTSLGEVDIPRNSWYRGDFDLSGNLHVTNGSNLYVIDVDATPPTVTSAALEKVGDPSLNFHDIAYNRVTNTFFTFTQGQVNEIDHVALTIEKKADYAHVIDGKPFGAAFTDSNGDFYTSRNSTGTIYFADLDENGDVLNFFPLGDGGANGNNDGASCAIAAAPFEMSCSDEIDNDGDGLTDSADSDCVDLDGDTIVAILDIDDDNDGIPDVEEMETATNGGDSDGDGLKDSDDLDSNGNGTFDNVEANVPATDTDGDGTVDGPFGENGLADSLETETDNGDLNYTIHNDDPNSTPPYQRMTDTDGDMVADIFDLDDDNDGIPDTLECTYSSGSFPIAVVNGSFEDPDINRYPNVILQQWGRLPVAAVSVSETDVEGWNTTASDNRIEIWANGFNGVESYSGIQHAEINANGTGALYQDVATTPNSTMVWSFAHRGRSGPDTIRLNIGAAGHSLVTVQTMTTDRNGWVVYSGEYVVPHGQTVTRFEYEAVSTASGNNTIGNFLDNIQFYEQSVTVNCNVDTDGDLIIDALDLDSDGDGLSDSFEAGYTADDIGPDGRLKGDVGENGLVDTSETESDSGVINRSIPDEDDDQTPDFQSFKDFDGDGILKDDLDLDNDGIPNTAECGLIPCQDDFDGDGVPNAIDLDSDNDGVNDLYELRSPSDYVINVWLGQIDPDGDGMVSGDVGSNGYLNEFETDDTQNATYNEAVGVKPADDDNDGSPNFLDIDNDGDDTFDIVEAGLNGFDENHDGAVDNPIDFDHDGIADVVDGEPVLFGDQFPVGLTVKLATTQLAIVSNSTVTLTAVINNVGSESAHNLDLAAAMPDEFQYVAPATGSWSVTELAAGSSYTVTWQVEIGEIDPNQSYDIAFRAVGEDGSGSAIVADSQAILPADTDPDDRDEISFIGLEGEVCEAYVKNVAFEDLKNTGWSDWDYNDLIVNLDASLCYTPSSLKTDQDQVSRLDPGEQLAIATPANACGDVTIEAESGALTGFEIGSDPAASNGQYVHIPSVGLADYTQVSASRVVTYSVEIPTAGTYQIHGLVRGENRTSDSVWIALNDAEPMIWEFSGQTDWGIQYVDDYVLGTGNVEFELEAGTHVLSIYNREDGAQVDQLTFDCLEDQFTPQYSLGQAVITYTLLARGAGYDHALVHNLPFDDGGRYDLTIYDGNGDLVSNQNGTFDPANPIEIFASTQIGLPPYSSNGNTIIQTNTDANQSEYVNGYTAVLAFAVNHPEDYVQGEVDPFPWDIYMPVHNTGEEVHLLIPGHLSNTQLVNGEYDADAPLIGHNLPLGFSFDEEWTWPTEFTGIWHAYPKFVDYIESGNSQSTDWFANENAEDAFRWLNRSHRSWQEVDPLQSNVNSRYFASPVVADLDNNGQMEIIIGDLIGNQMNVLNSDKTVQWVQPTNGGIRATAMVQDIDFDGDLEIMVGDSEGYLHAWHHDGEIVTSFPISVTTSRILASPTVVDLEDDGEFDILQVASDGKLYRLDLSGNQIWVATLSNASDQFGSQTINGAAVAEDLDGDGDLEILVSDVTGTVQAYDHNGNRLWSFGAGDSITSTPVIDEFDPNNPGLEIVFGSGDSYLYVIDRDGELVWRRATGWIIRSTPLLVDSDGDGFQEIFIGGDDGNLHAYHYWGETVAGWPQAVGGAILSAPVAGDIDADGEDEILLAGEDGKLYAWDSNGAAIQSWPKQTGAVYKGSPAVIDLDGDPEEEIVAVDFSGSLFVWGNTEEDPIIEDVELIFLPMVNR